MMRRREIDMTEGKLGGKILLFALPLALTGILQQLFNAADVAVIGQLRGTDSMAAVGSNSALISLLVNLFVGISLGTNVVIARHTGEGDYKGIHDAVHTAIPVALIGGLFLSVIGELAAEPLLRLMDVDPRILPLSLRYLRIYLLGLPVIFLYNFEAAIFRSRGNTRTPLFCLMLSGAINVGLNIWFVAGLGMDVEGVALATVASNLISASLLFVLLLHEQSEIHLRLRDLMISEKELGMMVRIGLPAGLQSAVFSVSNMTIQRAVNSFGPDVMAASSAAFNIEIFAYFIINAFGQACTTFVGQNLGAGRIDRCRIATRLCLLLDAAFTVGMSCLILLFGKPLLAIFNSSAAVAEFGMIRLRFLLSTEILNMLIEVLSGAMRGYGRALLPASITVLGVCGVRITWVFTIFRAFRSFGMLMAVYPVSWVVTSAALGIAYAVMQRHLLKDPDEHAQTDAA